MNNLVLYERLRREPSTLSVPGSLPVLFFGDLFTAKCATISLNPSPQEYLDRDGLELQGAHRRFETLASLGARSRADLTDLQCDQAILTMRDYYQPGRPVYRWFRSFLHLADGLELDYGRGHIAHLDLIQEATTRTWSAQRKASPEDFNRLLASDTRFLKWQLESFPLAAVLCNGRTPFENVCRLTSATIVRTERMARLSWYVAVGGTSARRLVVAGWNLPLARPTGLGTNGEVELGKQLRLAISEIDSAAMQPPDQLGA
jgi:hypothetical protein